MDQVLKGVYENIGEPGSLSSPTTLAQVTGIKKKLAKEYLQKEPSYTLHRNHRTRGRDYRKTKAFYPLHILEADFLTLDKVQRRHNKPTSIFYLQ